MQDGHRFHTSGSPRRSGSFSTDAVQEGWRRRVRLDRLWSTGAPAAAPSQLQLPVEGQPPRRHARRHDLSEGEPGAGRVVRMPSAGIPYGNRLFLETQSGVLALPATAKTGHAVLERELERQRIRTGDQIVVTYRGMRAARGGGQRYRSYEVRRV